MTKFTATYMSVPAHITSDGYTVSGNGYVIGTKEYSTYNGFSTDVSKAFAKTMPANDKLVVKVDYLTEHRGSDQATLTVSNYSVVLPKISANLTASKMTLSTLLA